VIVVLSDTHRRSGTGLEGHTANAVSRADRVVHAGDFTTIEVLEAHREAARRLDAVHGNRDDDAVCETLPAERTLTVGDLSIALTHRREGGATGLAMWGRAQGADLVISGHTHRPAISRAEDVVLLNPGSHAQPRGGPATHAELEVTPEGLRGQIRTRDGDQWATLSVCHESEKPE
jgi:putative phosphoesterase